MATLNQKVSLLRGLADGGRAFGGPIFADVDVTRRCNLACVGCQYHASELRTPAASNREVQDISMSLVHSLAETFRKVGTREVFLTGEGEPLLHPDIPDIVAAFKACGAKVHLITNGTVLDERLAGSLIESGLDFLRVSIWGNTEAEYRATQVRGAEGKFDRALDGVRTMVAAKRRRGSSSPGVVLVQPINRANQKGIHRRAALARELGCDAVAFTAFRNWGEEFRSSALSPAEVAGMERLLEEQRGHLESLGLRHNIDRILARYRLGPDAWRTLPCYAGWYFTRVRADGTVIPCQSCTAAVGNVLESGFGEVWNGERYRAFRRTASRPGGLAELADRCDCEWCCYVEDNHTVHRFARWIPRRSGGGSGVRPEVR